MDTSEKFAVMLNKAMKQHPNSFKNFDRRKNVQDQLQDMIGELDWMRKLVALYDFAFIHANEICVSCFEAGAFRDGEKFYEECIDVIIKTWNSREQLLLACVMNEKFKKTWNNDKQTWVAND